MTPRHFLSLADFTADELESLFEDADDLYGHWGGGSMPQCLRGKRIALWFFDSGFRNRVAFEIGARAMGADVSFIPGSLGRRENVVDMASYLGNWFDAAVIRAEQHEQLLAFGAASPIPVVNARTNHSHPCEVLGDLHSIRRRHGSLAGLRVAFVGEASNLCYPWFEAAAALPISVTQVCPVGYEAAEETIAALSARAVGELAITHDFDVVRHADVISTDCWPQREPDNEHIAALFSPYRITAEVLDRCRPTCLFLPCPPVTRGEEADESALRHPCCMVYEAKKFLLHSQNAVLRYVLEAS